MRAQVGVIRRGVERSAPPEIGEADADSHNCNDKERNPGEAGTRPLGGKSGGRNSVVHAPFIRARNEQRTVWPVARGLSKREGRRSTRDVEKCCVLQTVNNCLDIAGLDGRAAPAAAKDRASGSDIIGAVENDGAGVRVIVRRIEADQRQREAVNAMVDFTRRIRRANSCASWRRSRSGLRGR